MVSGEAGESEVISGPIQQNVFRIVVTPKHPDLDGYGRALLRKAHQLGFVEVSTVQSAQLFFLQGALALADAQHLANLLLLDPVTESMHVEAWESGLVDEEDVPAGSQIVIETTFLPGVTDPPGDNLVRAAGPLGIYGLQHAATGSRFLLEGNINFNRARAVAGGILANNVVQRYVVNRRVAPPFTPTEMDDPTVEFIDLRDASDDKLLRISQERRLSLDLREMQVIQAYYRAERRDATDVELETLAQTWSEHCVHKTFKALISYQGPLAGDSSPAMVEQQIDGLLDTYIRKATEDVKRPWVRSAFVDNAGIIAFDEGYDLAFKVETHNHPSALEPFGGANTGIGGVVRDVLGVSARPVANTDVLCFGPPDASLEDLPEGVLHPRRIADGVVAGIEDYGNKMGIPTVNGSIHYHEGYTANPLVYCGCLGILPHGSHPTEVQAGDLIVTVGGRTGRDGLRGATFSSMEMDISTSEIAGSAVQIGNPIMEKQVQELILRARDEGLYTAITDCGAGGFSSAVGEMGENVGARVELKRAPLKYPGLRPWEIWLSEAQERMVLAVPEHNWQRLQEIAREQDVEATCLGEFEASGRLRIFYADDLVGDLSMEFLHDGVPRRNLQASWQPPQVELEKEERKPFVSPQDLLLTLLAHPDIRSKENVVRRYDHEVQGGTAVKPFVGIAEQGPSDAAVIVPQAGQEAGTPRGVALGNGICPNYGFLDPYRMAWAAIDEAVRNVVAVGADPETIAILDNFCWGNPNLPDRLGSLVRCAQGCYDAAVTYQTPFISGKDSLYNEYTGADGQKHAIPGTLLISAVGILPDAGRAVTMDLKQPGSFLFVVGETRAELGASHFSQVGGRVRPQHQVAPQPNKEAPVRFKILHRAIHEDLVLACHDCSEGGLAVALAEMCLAGQLGARVELMAVPRDPYNAYAADEAILFSESLSRFIVEVSPQNADAFKEMMGDIPHACIGVTGGDRLHIAGQIDPQKVLVDLSLVSLDQAWRGHLSSAVQKITTPHRGKKARAGDYAPAAHTQAPKVLILHAHGTNRDGDAALACRLAGGDPEIVHVNQLLDGERDLLNYHMLVIPGGFSYGDDLGAGVLWAADLQYLFGDAVQRFVENGRPVLGICNGFQALVKAGILPGEPFSSASRRVNGVRRKVTLTYNERAHFECRWVYLAPQEKSSSLFIRGVDEPIYCPVAHGEGRIAVQSPQTANALWEENLVALTYTNLDGSRVEYPTNPNGSVLDIAGLSNKEGNVLGLMPHPENHIFPWQHPRRGRGESGLDGLRLFKNGILHA
jgi:phosphoribosylformylglycinamidine synthase